MQPVIAVHLDSQHGSLHLKMLLPRCGADGRRVRVNKLCDSTGKARDQLGVTMATQEAKHVVHQHILQGGTMQLRRLVRPSNHGNSS